jgi:UDP-N-acetylglucosamine--N-acetylmuramyl-(pentapeptide) pyrophosphoryl-undecaprenol N-acetylglucosamine transferase
VVIHESDSAPGRVNKWAGSFAERIALSYKDAAVYFPAKNIAWTGQPVRSEIENITEKNKALRYFKLESELPVVLVLGGSQGAELINNVVIDALPELIKKYQVIHQTGVNNFKVVHGRAEVVLGNNPDRAKYTPLAFLNPLQMKNAAGAADIVVSRAGSQIFEIAAWGIPSILIPITNSNQDHQKKNAFAYARAGCCSVIEEMNMTSHILISEIDRLINDKNLEQHMKDSTKNFYKPDAAMKIAREIVNIALSHEK